MKERLVLYMRGLVLSARGNVVSFTLKQAKRALWMESKSEEVALKGALEALASLGLLQKTPGRKPRYIIQRGSPLWKTLEQGLCTDLLTALMARPRRCPQAAEARRRDKPTGMSSQG